VNIKKLHIKNFKSLVDVEIIEPNPFTVFVGPNGSGKSNIFEALEFGKFCYRFSSNDATSVFGTHNIIPKNIKTIIKQESDFQENILMDTGLEAAAYPVKITINIILDNLSQFPIVVGFDEKLNSKILRIADEIDDPFEYIQYINNFSRIFIGNSKLRRLNIFDDKKLNTDAINLENVLDRLLKNVQVKAELEEYLQLLIPELEKIEIIATSLSNTKELLVYEKSHDEPFTKNLVSDGTYNILSLLTAVLQNDEPQFLCIEEPENDLHPFAIKQLVTFFRQQCREKGHYIWLNTHSQTLVSELKPEEIITVNKADGATVIKQHKGEDIHHLTMDEAWLSNALGGGVPW
jgi:AAA15 family ATPase/GTPase